MDPRTAFRAFAVSTLVTLLLTPLLRNLSRGAGWLDRPDGGRKAHAVAVPPCGGCAIFLGMLTGCLFYFSVPAIVWGAAAIILLTGIADDRSSLRPWQKLASQAVAAALALVAVPLPPGLLPRAGAMAWLLLCSNAFNLLDGLDGLVAAVGLIAAVAMLVVHPAAACLLVPLAGSLAAFLVFNCPPASVFLGDSGSLVVGFILGWTALQGSPERAWPPAALILALPLADTALTLTGRLLHGKPLFQPDREHIHHRLVRSVRSPLRALLWLSAASTGCALLGVALSFAFPGLP
jgi:UDP-GlcNAc:undecaprenyl-phosphate/decaprenyl-phosphate GlcNAc-1-phosphate transferase